MGYPRLAKLAPRTCRLLERLSSRPRLAVGLVSGRMIHNLKDLVGLPGLYYGGTNGLELDLGGVRLRHPQAEKRCGLIKALLLRLRDGLAAYPGAWVEDKRFGLTVHYRAVARHQIGELRTHTAQILRPVADHVHVLDGPMAVEATVHAENAVLAGRRHDSTLGSVELKGGGQKPSRRRQCKSD